MDFFNFSIKAAACFDLKQHHERGDIEPKRTTWLNNELKRTIKLCKAESAVDSGENSLLVHHYE